MFSPLQGKTETQKLASEHADGRINSPMAVMEPNVAGVIGSAVAAGMFLALLR